MLFCCHACAGDGDPCELRVPDADVPQTPARCPFGLEDRPRWHEVPSGRSTVDPAGAALLPGPFCEVPPAAIVRAVAEAGRYALEIGALDCLVIPCSRTAFNEAVRAMEAVCRGQLE